MRILHLDGRYTPIGGAETYLGDLCRAQTEMGHEVAVAYASSPAGTLDAGVFFLEPSPGIRSGLRTKKRSLRSIAAFDPDLIHMHVVQYYLSPDMLRAIIRRWPTVFTVHDILWLCLKSPGNYAEFAEIPSREQLHTVFGYFLHMLRQKGFRPRSYDLARVWRLYELKKATALLVHSEHVKEALRRFTFPAGKIEVLNPYLPLCEEWRKQAASPSHGDPENIVLFVGRITPYKGILDLFDALVPMTDIDWRLIAVGDGYGVEILKSRAQAAGLSSRVELAGAVPRKKLGYYYKRAALVIVPSRCPETLGYVGLEAMFFGKPVVACSFGMKNDWLIEGETGYQVESGNIPGLRSRIAALLTDREQAKKLGENGRKQVARFLDRRGHVEKLTAVYERCIEQTDAGAF